VSIEVLQLTSQVMQSALSRYPAQGHKHLAAGPYQCEQWALAAHAVLTSDVPVQGQFMVYETEDEAGPSRCVYSGPLTYELNSFPRAGRNSSWS
jgi:hypothetical protein